MHSTDAKNEYGTGRLLNRIHHATKVREDQYVGFRIDAWMMGSYLAYSPETMGEEALLQEKAHNSILCRDL
jgi:hypothetical protein